ncbi:F-box protein [Thalictrum thalictroides]|uniref:F-box protein n=1 Tax=Thalictrum thalictroides TaxID=46969 RepID=A0A7J6WCE6_THATH|nr:F-box protein [Thalictrum thalictroides]
MKNTDGSDRLSSLHDSVLSHILGFLDMKQVVHTSLLSKRWRYVWKSVSSLNFDHSFWIKIAQPVGFHPLMAYMAIPPFPRLKYGFMDFVDHILSIHEGSVIDKFNLYGAGCCQKDRVDEWLSTVIRCRIQEIHLDLYTALPQFFFTSSSTTHLKKLLLASIQLPDSNSEGEIMLDCPVLETLILINCHYAYNPSNVFLISAPQLRKLVCRSLHISCTIKLCAPNLISVTCTGSLLRIYHMENISSQELRVTIASQRTNAQELLELLRGLKYATTLDISNCWLSFSDNSDHDKSTNMEKLDVEEPFEFMVQELKIQDLQGNEDEFMVLGILFKHAPYLKTVHITTTRARKSAIRKPLAKFGKKLHSLHTASTSVRIKFVVKTRM